MKSVTNNSPHCTLTTGCKDTYIEETVNTKFFGLYLDNHLNWKDNIDQMVPTLSGACYAVRLMFHISNINTLKSIYFVYFHSFITYAIIFWGNSSNSRKAYLVFRKVHSILASEFSAVLHGLPVLKNQMARFKVALRRYLSAHSVYSVDEFLYVYR
jgi:hypothetical protein